MNSSQRPRDSFLSRLAIAPILFYQRHISPLKPSCCRFIPNCSRYAITAICRFGPLRGGLMALCRILRCNPLCKGGYDPVPEHFSLRPFAAAREQAAIFPDTAMEEEKQ